MKVKLKFIIAVCLVMIAALSVILVRQYHKADTAHATDVTESNGAKIGFFQAGDGVYLHEEYWSSGIYYTYTYDSSSIFSAPQTEEHNWHGGDVFYYQFKNQYSVSPSTYIIFSNAVISTDGKTYDLLIRPFTCDSDARIIFYGRLNTGKEGYFLGGIAHGGRYGMQLFIVEHGTGTNENPNFVEMSTIMGIADLDYNEGLIIPMSSGFEPIHIGSSVLTAFSDDVDDAIFYYGKSNSNSEDDMYNTHCLFGKVKIPTSGLTIYYHGPGNVALMDFEALSSYGVIFNDEYGNGNVPAPILKSGEGGLGTVMGQAGSQVPAREGYMFKGWSVTKEYSSSNRILFASNTNSGTTFQDYCNLAGVDPNASKILNLYAQWEPVYEVHFNANGGSGNVPDTLSNFGDNMNVVMGATQTKVPTRTGYVFKGWSANPTYAAGNKIFNAPNTNSSTTFQNYCNMSGGTPSGNKLTVYAQWEPIWDVVFNINGGSGSVPATISGSGLDANAVIGATGSQTPTKSGYAFKGWSATPTYTGSNKVFTASNTNGSTTFASYCSMSGGGAGGSTGKTLTVYAQWEPVYNVVFNANGGTGNMPSTLSNSGLNTGVAMGATGSQTPTKSGYVFKGWSGTTTYTGTNKVFTAANTGSSTSFQNYCDMSGGTPSGRTLTLYAQWEPVWTITFNANGGTGNMPSTLSNSGLNTGVAMGATGSQTPTREGYVFKGWSAVTNYTGTNKVFTAANTNSSTTFAQYLNMSGGTASNYSLTLYAQWEPLYYVVFDANNGTGDVPSTLINSGLNTSIVMGKTGEEMPERESYFFRG